MDVNDVARGKGGFYAVDAADGTLDWFFDLESGAVCRPDAGDEIRAYDGYHSEAELGLPAGFLATRDRLRSPADDERLRQRVVVGRVRRRAGPAVLRHEQLRHRRRPERPRPRRRRCRRTTRPSSRSTPMARRRGGGGRVRSTTTTSPSARRRTCSRSTSAAQPRDVVGIGGKDGTYYVARPRRRERARRRRVGRRRPVEHCRTGGRRSSPAAPPAASSAPRRSTRRARRVVLLDRARLGPVTRRSSRPSTRSTSTPVRSSGRTPVRPASPADASFGPTSGVPGVVIVGSVVTPHLRIYDATDGTLLLDRNVGSPGTLSGIASGAAVLDGTLVVGAGIGARSSGGSSPGDFAANTPSASSRCACRDTPGC